MLTDDDKHWIVKTIREEIARLSRPSPEAIEQRVRSGIAQIVACVAPDVVRIRYRFGRDWTNEPCIYFRVLLSDAAASSERLKEVTEKVGRMLGKLTNIEDIGMQYINYRSASEQAKMHDPDWD